MPDEVLLDRQDGVLTITINRPEARNALNRAVAEGVAAAVDELDASDDLRVGILTGAGGTFSSGMDLKAFMRGETPSIEGRGLCGIAETPPRKPLIGAVEGWALAGGFELLLACDLVVAAEDSRFGVPEVKRSLVAAGGAALALPRRIPQSIALEMLLTGDPISAPRAAEVGLVNRVTPSGEALAGARALAAVIAANGPLAVAATKPPGPLRAGLDLRAGLEGAGIGHRAGLRQRGRPRGRHRVRREARAPVEEPLTAFRTR
ncbi:crotonase/enoyl-CoA hydratase family protein [Blastococcus sp. TML/C7B]|uniref:crotonase/enoyl-CoA hydratase family protein n=1 Tax=Blastococcus sp. TML/C7B TaxID=2798728 RepID=UPI00281610D7|nr:crotonase/enoyl-CoA hydratase family protein [Blastococcus sp. TML/C7B]